MNNRNVLLDSSGNPTDPSCVSVTPIGVIVGLGFVMIVNFYALTTMSRDTSKLTLILYFILGLCAVLAYITGDDAEKLVTTIPGITETVVEPHENIALFFFISLIITAATAAVGLSVIKKMKPCAVSSCSISMAKPRQPPCR